MAGTRNPHDPPRDRPLTPERLRQLLDAYGAVPARWPDGERHAALRLVQQSADARARWDDAADLDLLLDSVPVDPPSATLTARVLAAAPRRRSVRSWRGVLAVAVPLAAAAAVTLWITTAQKPATPGSALTSLSVGVYSSPTDVLLQPYGIDVYATVPSIGCADSQLGCPEVKGSRQPVSQLDGKVRV